MRVPKALEVEAPVVVRLTGTGLDEVVWGHVVVEVAEQARATVVLEHTGSAHYAANVSVLVGDGASLQLVQVQDWADDAVHGAHVASRLGRDARLVSTAGHDRRRPGPAQRDRRVHRPRRRRRAARRLVRRRRPAPRGAGCSSTTRSPNCRSNVLYKSALHGDEAHTVWVGDVLIRAAATGTDTYELNRNLLLTPEARADSVPNLEIETGEIAGAGHASATGRFDDEQLFYLQSRGIPTDVARRMVVRGFFADVVEDLGVPALEERLMATIEAELERAFA